jgi:branched-chain amino acid transport system substrate-binding protein
MKSVGGYLTICVAAFALVGCRRASAPEPVLIGHLASLSGADKAVGDHAKQAILLAVEAINNEEKQTPGRRLAVLHPNYPPDEPDKLQPVAVRLITVDKVAALLGGIDGEQARILGRAAEPYEVPLVTPAELPAELLGANIFSVNFGLDIEGQTLARFAAEQLHVNRVALWVDVRRAATTAVAAAFVKEFSRGGSNEAQEWTYKNASDLSDLILRAKNYRPQALVHAGSVVDLGRARTKLREAGLKLPILVGGDGEHLPALQADKDASEGVFVATPFVPGEGPESCQEFTRKYQARFHEPPDSAAALAYDGVQILFQAMRRANSFQPGKLREELTKAEENPFEGLMGKLSFSRSHAARRPLYVVQLEAGALKRPILYPIGD